MEIGLIGLGRMGSNIVRRLVAGGHWVLVYDIDADAMKELTGIAAGTKSLSDIVNKLSKPRILWVMVPSGKATEATITELNSLLTRGDILIDGGNSHYTESQRRADSLAQKGIIMLDVGTSGGIWGLKEGYCLMVGGDAEAYKRIEPILKTLAPTPDTGYGYMGKSGAGHFVKMVHNGIEYGLMEAYAEGFELMKAKKEMDLDLIRIAQVWQHGSVVRSWLLDLLLDSLKDVGTLSKIASYVDDSGEGRWTVQESIDLAVPLPAITTALEVRFRSRQNESLAGKLLAALRHQFGGHPLHETKIDTSSPECK
jgi:6-phosphogluconate dehydrogenase